MPKFRKKPTIIDAMQYEGNGNLVERVPPEEWLWEGFEKRIIHSTNGSDPLMIDTLEGTFTVSPGDFIVRGIKGEFYAIKPDIFKALHDEVIE